MQSATFAQGAYFIYLQIAWNKSGDIVYVYTLGAGGGTPNAGIAGVVTGSSGTFDDLAGWGFHTGGSAGKVGYDYGFGSSFSFGESVLPAEGHGEVTYTWMVPIIDGEELHKAERIIEETLSDLPEDVKEQLDLLTGGYFPAG